ncbi:hypothetical protein [Thauera sp. 2A1]|uniref:hypothetical protein n=1 Tax=Thauera sp. 2A1 TaxID=2570191 RepID=UPI001291A1CC|nr:hypothetical protein [Thauera sp. 2A1]KAI5914601.1 hypothetical protein GH664_11690 [Thauera sp. 2A1]
MTQHIADIPLALNREMAERAYVVTLLRYLADEIECAETNAEWAGQVVAEDCFGESWRILKDAEETLPGMIARMGLHLRIAALERAMDDAVRGAK